MKGKARGEKGRNQDLKNPVSTGKSEKRGKREKVFYEK